MKWSGLVKIQSKPELSGSPRRVLQAWMMQTVLPLAREISNYTIFPLTEWQPVCFFQSLPVPELTSKTKLASQFQFMPLRCPRTLRHGNHISNWCPSFSIKHRVTLHNKAAALWARNQDSSVVCFNRGSNFKMNWESTIIYPRFSNKCKMYLSYIVFFNKFTEPSKHYSSQK